jgi:tetratricopeptide (TPR) repeat protein
MAVLLVLVIGYSSRSLWESSLDRPDSTTPAPLPGKNTISGLKVEKDPKGRWMATFDYFYTGEPSGALFNLELSRGVEAASAPAIPRRAAGFGRVERGAHHSSIEINRPDEAVATTTRSVAVHMRANGQVLASEQTAQRIDWPEFSAWIIEREIAQAGPESVLARAVGLIDNGDTQSLSEAKHLLERLIGKDARHVPAYIELARVAMKSNWGPEGLHQAETLLASALQIQPESANAKVLLGYVYAHQGRYKPAEALMVEAVNSGTTNMWVWADWGELLAMQGKIEPAIQKYREGLARPRSDAANDRARLDTYWHLLALLERRKDVVGMEDLHKRRAEEFGPGSCYSADYSRFVLQQRGDSAAAVALARDAVEGQCRDARARTALGLAYYVAWASATDPQRLESLNQARVFLPAGPRVLYLLAGSERTMGAAKQLIAAGEAVDQKDNYKLNALAYALQERDHAAARRLLQLGARVDTTITEGEFPVALTPVMSEDIEGVRMMQKFGVDYSKLRYQGRTAIDEAKRTGNRRMLEALDPKLNSL